MIIYFYRKPWKQVTHKFELIADFGDAKGSQSRRIIRLEKFSIERRKYLESLVADEDLSMVLNQHLEGVPCLFLVVQKVRLGKSMFINS